MPLNLYLLERLDVTKHFYDSIHACVVCASNPDAARDLCSKNAKGEGRAVWQDPAQVTITLLGVSCHETPGIILRDINES